MDSVKVISFQAHLDAFDFLGVENTLSDGADFGAFWEGFFAKGGYEPIDPFAAEPGCTNVCYNDGDKAVYFQGKIVRKGAAAPAGYSLKRFPAGDYLVATTEWLPTHDDAMRHINHDYYRSAPAPEGFRRRPENGDGIFLIERWGAQTEEGFRYEFWVPIEKV